MPPASTLSFSRFMISLAQGLMLGLARAVREILPFNSSNQHPHANADVSPLERDAVEGPAGFGVRPVNRAVNKAMEKSNLAISCGPTRESRALGLGTRCGIFYDAYEIADGFYMVSSHVSDVNIRNLVFDHNQQLEAVQPIGAEVAQPSIVNHPIKLYPEVSSDDSANVSGGSSVHVALPMPVRANHFDQGIIAGLTPTCARLTSSLRSDIANGAFVHFSQSLRVSPTTTTTRIVR